MGACIQHRSARVHRRPLLSTVESPKRRVGKRHGRLASVIVVGDATRSVGRTTVYVQLLNEAVDVWRPVVAEHVEGDKYRLIGPKPDDETWPFAVGDVVRCEPRRLSGGVVPVACETA
jgi:hypothetical protein